MIREFFNSLFSRLFNRKSKPTSNVVVVTSPEEKANQYALEILGLETQQKYIEAEIREKEFKIVLLGDVQNSRASSKHVFFLRSQKSPAPLDPKLLESIGLHNDIATLSRELNSLNKKLVKKKNAFYEFFCEFSKAEPIGFQGEKLNEESKTLIKKITENKKLDSNIFYDISLDDDKTSADITNNSKNPESSDKIHVPKREKISLKKIPRPEKSIWLRLAGVFKREHKEADQIPNILREQVNRF